MACIPCNQMDFVIQGLGYTWQVKTGIHGEGRLHSGRHRYMESIDWILPGFLLQSCQSLLFPSLISDQSIVAPEK